MVKMDRQWSIVAFSISMEFPGTGGPGELTYVRLRIRETHSKSTTDTQSASQIWVKGVSCTELTASLADEFGDLITFGV